MITTDQEFIVISPVAEGRSREDDDRPTIEDALEHALTSHVEGAATRWLQLQRNGATDAELLARIADEFQGCGGSSRNGGFSVKGGKSPQFTWSCDGIETGDETTLKGKRLLAKVREVLGIGAPGSSTCPLCGEGVQKGHICEPGKSPKPLVDPAACCVCGHRADAHAPFNSPEEPPQECVECSCDLFVDASTAPPAVRILRDAEDARLHEKALARWRRERPASAEAGEANGCHPQMLQMIPVDEITPSQTNPRKYFDPAKLQELADSIVEHGLIEPVLVRRIQNDPVKNPAGIWSESFELVAGERRWRAVKLAGLTEIEAKVRDLDDKAVLEIQFIENLQRTDLSAIEEAEGYRRLLDEHGYTAESLAGKLAKSKSYVYGRLKLCGLPAAAMYALAKGDLPATVGELIGRLPSMEMREQFWREEFESYGEEYFEMPSFRDIRETIERKYMRELKSAPWNKKDAKLIPDAGACVNCPKMTGNNRAEFPDARADMCTDTPCYDRKLKAHLQRQVEKAKNSGAQVLSQPETAKVFDKAGDTSWLSFEATQKYVELKDQVWHDKEKRSYKQLLEGHLEPVVAIDQQGKTHYLAPKAEAERVLKEVHGIKSESRNAMSDYKASEKKRQEEKKLRQATAAEIVTQALAGMEYNLLADTDFLRAVAKFLVDHGDADVARAIAKRREVKYENDVRGSVEKIVEGLDDADVPGLIVEWLLQRELEFWAQWGSEENRFSLCEYFGVKPKVVMKQVAAKVKEAAKVKPGAKAKAAARA